MSYLKHNFRHAVAHFADNSTMHGFKDIKDASNITIKAIWALALCASITLLGYQTKLFYDSYLEETTAVSMNTEFIDEDLFQSVIYCSDDWIHLEYDTIGSQTIKPYLPCLA